MGIPDEHNNLRVNILIPLWGSNYVSEFIDLTLLGLLHKKNLPSIDNLQTSVTFLTTRKDKRTLQESRKVKYLHKYAKVKYISIDDLITPFNYSVVLTLAYSRGMRSVGDANYFNTLFVFLNSDFYLSNGSLRKIVEAANTGASAIFGTSLRINSDAKDVRFLKKQASNSNEISSNRNLVKYSLKHLHPTVKAMDIDNRHFSSTIYSKIYSKPNDELLLSHDYIYCCMGVVPVRKLTRLVSYIDYSFVPELCDMQRLVYLNDSDQYLCLEFQDSAKESGFIETKPKSSREIAKLLSSWTTEQHRIYADQTIVFHTKSLQKRMELEISIFENKFKQIASQLKEPVAYTKHKFWIAGVRNWQHVLRTQNRRHADWQPPHELELIEKSLSFRLGTLTRLFKNYVITELVYWRKILNLEKNRRPQILPSFISREIGSYTAINTLNESSSLNLGLVQEADRREINNGFFYSSINSLRELNQKECWLIDCSDLVNSDFNRKILERKVAEHQTHSLFLTTISKREKAFLDNWLKETLLKSNREIESLSMFKNYWLESLARALNSFVIKRDFHSGFSVLILFPITLGVGVFLRFLLKKVIDLGWKKTLDPNKCLIAWVQLGN